MPKFRLRNLLFLLLAGIILVDPNVIQRDVRTVRAAAIDTVCRFGMTSPLGSVGYDIASLGVGAYLDWGAAGDPVLPAGVEYIRVLRVRDDLYGQTLANLTTWIQAHPGSVWVVGNEPDTTYGNQDALLPEAYADRFYELAQIIRAQDPSARTAFGSIVQPTPIRMRYLDRAWARLADQAGSYYAASKLIDIWSIHSFILNEDKDSWGTSIPPGFENDYADAVIITDFSDTYSIEIFQERLIAFRSWLAGKGEREKPLWITEYGSLFPPEDPPGGPNYVNVSDENTATFMLATFDFLLSASNTQTGQPADDNQLVQRWFWYSLNEHRYKFGGSIFNPDYPNFGPQITWVGKKYIEYQTSNLTPPDLFPAGLIIAPISFNPDRTLVNYRLDLTIDNSLFSDATCAQVWIYDGDPDAGGVLIAGPISSSAIRSHYGQGVVSAFWMGVQPQIQHSIYVQVDSIGIPDTYPENNRGIYYVYTVMPIFHFLPIVHR
jgi:hypothetical protein